MGTDNGLGGYMSEFKSVRSYSQFAYSVSSRWRYVRDEDQEAFLNALMASSKSRIEIIPSASLVFRAQLGCDWPETAADEEADSGPRPYAIARMLPLKDRAPEGRANPRGIPVLYAATREETAAAEVRPWIGAYVSVAQLRTRRDVRVINCTSDEPGLKVYLTEPDPEERERAVWRDIDRAFARPVERNEHSAEYAPTQLIAEVFRKQGLDGIGYRSSLGLGHNLALFDLEVADLLNCTVLYVNSLRFDMRETTNRYYVSKHYPELGRDA